VLESVFFTILTGQPNTGIMRYGRSTTNILTLTMLRGLKMEFKIGDFVKSIFDGIEGIIIQVPSGDLPRRYRLYCTYDETYHKPGDKFDIIRPDRWELVK